MKYSGVTSYSDRIKREILDVPENVLRECGAVSGRTAALMAAQVGRLYGADAALSITGIAGPDGGSPAKPVGTFYVGLWLNGSARSFKFHFYSNRDRVRQYAAYAALDILRRALTGLRLPDADK